MQNHSSSSAAPVNIDTRRAQQLLERATALGKSGDFGGAILAARQSLALVPQNADGHAILGGLLERSNNYSGAATAYEKSVQLAPERAEFQEKLTSLREQLQQSQGAARQFQFDEAELYPGADAGAAPAVAPVTETPRQSSAPAEVQKAPAPVDTPIEARLPPSRAELETKQATPSAPVPDVAPAATPVVVAPVAPTPVVVAPVVVAPVAAIPVAPRLDPALTQRQADRRQVKVPVTVERRKTPTRRVAPPLIATPAARTPLALNVPAPLPIPAWKQIANRPSFYARTLPLVAVAVVSLGFLGWARGRAVSQVVAPVVSADPSAPTQIAAAPDSFQNPSNGQTAPVPNNVAPNNDAGFPISNVAPTPAPASAARNANPNPNSPAAPSRSAPSANRAPNSNRPAPRAVPRPVPKFPGVSIAPAPIPPASVPNQNNSGGGNVILPRPRIDLPAPSDPPTRVLPPDTGLNPAGSPGRGYVRVTEGRVGNGVIPAQPDAVARQSEQNASEAARNGQTDRAISQLSQAINADADNAGFRYQQRASLFLQRNDYGRARDDFQSAIAAYQNQIARGDNVAAARRGLSSARSGLNLALAELR